MSSPSSSAALAWALTLVPLSAADRRAASRVCRAWRDAINASWAYSGIAVRDNAVAELLLQSRWDALGMIKVYAPPDHRSRTPFVGLPRPLPSLWHLHLRRVTLSDDLTMVGVLAMAPRLRSVDLELEMYMSNYGCYLEHVRTLLVQGADQLETVALRGQGIVVYPLGLAGMETHAAFFAASEAKAWPAVCMPMLKTYANTGRQFAVLAVEAARLQTAEIHEPDVGDWIMERMVCPQLRSLVWRVPVPYAATAFPMFRGVVQRFQALRDLCVTFREVKTPFVMGVVLDSLAALPSGLTSLEMDAEAHWPLLGPVDWESRSPLAHLVNLRDLSLRVSYATRGFEGATELLGAPAGVLRVTVGAMNAMYPHDVPMDSENDDSDDSDDELEVEMTIHSWHVNPRVERLLAQRPACHVTIEHLPVTLSHPRLCVTRPNA